MASATLPAPISIDHQIPKVRIFLSSPSDVAPERESADRIAMRLNGIYSAHVEISLERWEHKFYEATKTFQAAIEAMAKFDVVVGILWKRIGTELPDSFLRPDGTPYESGTAYEIETAIAAKRLTGRPAVYVFNKTAHVFFDSERFAEERSQKDTFDKWWARTFRDSTGHYLAASNSFATTDEFEVKFKDWLENWLRQKQFIPDGPVWDVSVQGSPYPGLLPYDRDRRSVFFGRELAISQARDELLTATAKDNGRSALFVIGASGSGKSSLLRAGLVPRIIRPGGFPAVDLWRSAIVVPTSDSIAALAVQLYHPEVLPELCGSSQPTAERWARVALGSPEAAADTVVWALNEVAESERLRTGGDRKLLVCLLLLVDQLEESFGSSEQHPFSRLLSALVYSNRVVLLATFRSGRYVEFQRDPHLLALKRAGATYDLPPPGIAEIADIVWGPASAAGLIFADHDNKSLAKTLIESTPSADALPLLQMTLDRLFEKRDGMTLTVKAYGAIGGVEGAIASHADMVFAKMSSAAQRELPALIRAFAEDVTYGEGNQVRFLARSIDRKKFEVGPARQNLVQGFVEARLLVSDGERLRLAHEALLRRWGRASSILVRIANAELRKARLRALVAGVAAVIFFALGAYAFTSGRRAALEASRATAGESRALTALSSIAFKDGRPADGLKLALAAWPRDYRDQHPQLETTLINLSKAVNSEGIQVREWRQADPVSRAPPDTG
jgi:hypothetical protein